MTFPVHTLSTLLSMQAVEEHKPKTSKVSWLADVLVFRASIIPMILKPVLCITFWSAGVAAISLWWGKEVGLRNDIVVPLLSVVLTFSNSSAYERYSAGRKDFTTLISNARNLSRLIWVYVCLPTNPDIPTTITRAQLNSEKKTLIRSVVAFVVATKHHLRDEGGVHHEDLRGLLPRRLFPRQSTPSLPPHDIADSPEAVHTGLPGQCMVDEESAMGIQASPLHHKLSSHSIGAKSTTSSHLTMEDDQVGPLEPRRPRLAVRRRRPSAVRVIFPQASDPKPQPQVVTEQTPLIKPGVRPTLAKTESDVRVRTHSYIRAQAGMGRMIELGLPLIIRGIFRFRRLGCLEHVGPAGVNSMQSLVQSMIDQLGSMERVVQTPMPYIVAVHMKQATSLLLSILPFVLVDTLKLKMVPLMFCIALIYMGIEGIAAQVEQPFGTDPCDLNLDLFCTELLCECEALLENLPQGDEDDPTGNFSALDGPLDVDDDGGD
ncbi:Bestrophin, RFP-TM, chloride channel-domain-containing protein [Kockovaella imperatae]|uniref:Bestrophin, RFP-TM, chloride channel-domain-containing protein n=1 Tax=Kockovaella imperatae TaxID=4999 RepID=A0A1Y1UID3_9TREE|nr:Bestrophin, RFP-TM, chloride channel-domain-containing protein [Kockovaella imperatae]ORX37256.1 Bestrophin, RFP-TM, chloride channel-domain-containing protein [Kockovaella imperatae]